MNTLGQEIDWLSARSFMLIVLTNVLELASFLLFRQTKAMTLKVLCGHPSDWETFASLTSEGIAFSLAWPQARPVGVTPASRSPRGPDRARPGRCRRPGSGRDRCTGAGAATK